MKYFWFIALSGALLSCDGKTAIERDATKFLTDYQSQYQKLHYEATLLQWESNTHITPGDTLLSHKLQLADEQLAAFTGSIHNLERTRHFLKHKKELEPIQVKQLEAVLRLGANNPASASAFVKQRIKAETRQIQQFYGFTTLLNGSPISNNEIDAILRTEKDLAKRRLVWEASKEVGKVAKPGLLQLRDMRNQIVRQLDYPDYFSYQVSEYGMTSAEMIALVKRLNQELLPLYRELHTYARYELAKRYGSDTIPDMLPAHWLTNRFGQDWEAILTDNPFPTAAESGIESKSPEWVVAQAERFYQSIGYEPLPKQFYERSSLYPLPPGATYKKNFHASAWHLDFDQDARALMSVEPNSEWYETAHHELGHVYYYLAYSRPEVPIVLRSGANRAFHEAIGSLMGLAAMQKPFMDSIGLKTNEPGLKIQGLLREALNYAVFVPFGCGVMSEWEHDFYANNLPAEQMNKRWWELCRKYQGIVPPANRGEEFCDPASKTHINDDPAQYYDYALSYILLFQLHQHIASKILHQDPHATNYYGNKQIGEFLKSIMEPGATVDWRKLLKEKTGEEISATAMIRYFEPLMDYLKEQNKGRKYTI
jgi:peptidyl-dipeptidase A